jgi:hypothetical protein
MSGFGAYANTSRLMDDNVRAFKGLQSQVDSVNTELRQKAQEAANVEDLKSIGQEMAFQTTKKLFNTYGAKLYGANIPGASFSLQDLDQTAGKYLDRGLESVVNAGKNIPPPIESQSASTQLQSNRLNLSGDPEIDGLRVNNLYSRNLNASGIPVDTQNVGVESSEVNIVKPSQSSVEMSNRGPSSAPIEELAGDSGVVSENVLAEGAGDVAKVGAEKLGQGLGVEGSLQATAGVFGATGIGAPIAAAIEVGADIFGLVEGVKSIADLFNRDVLHNASGVQAPQEVMPTQPKSLAQKGFSITPSIDTYDLPHNTAQTGW